MRTGTSSLNLYKRIKCLAQGHSAVPLVRLEPTTPLSEVKHSTTEPPRSSDQTIVNLSVLCILQKCRDLARPHCTRTS